MKKKYKKLHNTINLLKKSNFRNNQNYILNNKLKNKIIKYAYTYNNGYYGMYSFTNKVKLKHKLYLNEIAYVKNNLIFKFNINKILIFIIIFLSTILQFKSIYKGGTLTKTINGVTTTINLNNLTILERFNELKIFFLLPIVFLFFYLGYSIYKNKFLKNHIIFKLFPNDKKFYIYRYK